MVETKRIAERHKSASARGRNQRQLLSANNSNRIVSPRIDSAHFRKTVATKFKKIVLFDSADEKDININDSSSSNGSDARTSTNSVSFGRSSRLSTRSNRSSGGTSSSSNGNDSFSNPPRPQRSISTPAFSRPSRESTRSVSDSVSVSTPRPLSRARVSSRGSFVSSDSLSTPRTSTARGLKRKERLRLSKSESMESVDSIDLYSPRDTAPPLPQPLSPEMIALTEQSKLVWDQFSTHVKMIDDSTELIARRPRKTFNSSGVFQKAMEDLYGSPEYWKCHGVMKFQNRVGAIAKFASKFIVGARRVKALHDSKGEESDENDLFLIEPSQETVENAQRGWRILRRHVQEMSAEKRMNQTTLTWDMLRHTIKGISNMQRARIDLYQRYGLLPIIKSDGTVVKENTMLSERARSAAGSKHNKPMTPSSARFPSASAAKNRSYAAIEGFSGTGRTNLDMSL